MKIKLLRLLTMAIFAVASTLAQNCSVCKDGSAVPNPSLPLALPDFPQLANTTCGIVESGISMFPLDSTTCTGLVGAANLDFLCGCPGSVQLCSLCPNGTSPGNPDLSFPGLNVTCTDIDDGLAFLGETSCSKISANISIFQELCGCPGVMPSCPLCEDGSMIPDPTLPVLGADFTCGFLQIFPTSSTAQCTAVQATGGVYCGCNNPTASESACRICGGSTLLPDPSRLILDTSSDFYDTPCGAIEFYATQEINYTCAEYQSMLAEGCCGKGSNQTTMAPDTTAPVATDTMAPVATGNPSSAAPGSAATSQPTSSAASGSPASTPPSTKTPTKAPTTSSAMMHYSNAMTATCIAFLAVAVFIF